MRLQDLLRTTALSALPLGRLGMLAALGVLAALGLPATAVAQSTQPAERAESRSATGPATRPAMGPATRAAATQASERDFVLRYPDYALVLREHVDERGLVDYAALAADPSTLDRALERMASIDPERLESLPPKERIAFWINAYNAATLKLIADHHPIQPRLLTRFVFPKNSIRQIAGAWDEIEWTIAGRDLTLDAMEHGILRERFDEPRIHAALVCAAMSCPPLRREPYVGARLDRQLDDQMRRFVRSPIGARVDREKRRIELSAIFDWFGEDFVAEGSDLGPTRAVLAAIAPHLAERNRALARSEDVDVDFLDYDWTLNDQAEAGRAP